MIDTWKRWCEAPVSPLARLSVTTFFAAVGFLLVGALNKFEEKIIDELNDLGANRIQIRERVSSFAELDGGLFLDGFGPYLSYGILPLQAQVETKHTFPVYALSDSDWDRVGELFPGLPLHAPLILSNKLTSHSPIGLNIKIGNLEFEASILNRVDSLLHSYFGEAVLISYSEVVPIGNLSHHRMYQIDMHDHGAIRSALASWIALEGFIPNKYQYTDASQLKSKLERFKRTKAQVLIGASFTIGFLVILMYMSLTIMEFKQSKYVVALMKSFGVSQAVIFFQRMLENIGIVIVSFGIGLMVSLTVSLQHSFLSQIIIYNARGTIAMCIIAASGMLAAFIATLPVLLYLKADPGKILK